MCSPVKSSNHAIKLNAFWVAAKAFLRLLAVQVPLADYAAARLIHLTFGGNP
jgi:hypothetical protein